MKKRKSFVYSAALFAIMLCMLSLPVSADTPDSSPTIPSSRTEEGSQASGSSNSGSSSNSNSSSKTMISHPNNGTRDMVFDGKYVYYLAFSPKHTIYRSLPDGSGKISLYTGENLQELNYKDGYLYFSNGYAGDILKIKNDGTGLTKIFNVRKSGGNANASVTVYDAFIVENTLYINSRTWGTTKGDELLALNLSNNKVSRLYSTEFGISDMTYDNGNFYLMGSSGKKIYKYNVAGKTMTTMNITTGSDAPATHYVQVSGDKLYYRSSGNVSSYFHSIDKDGSSNRQENVSFEFRSYIIVGSNVYYYDSSNGHIYRTTLNGSGRGTQITKEPTDRWFTYSNGYIYTRRNTDGNTPELIQILPA